MSLPAKKDLKKQREDLREFGLVLPLPYTKLGDEGTEEYTIRMRYVSAMDKAVVEAMPAETQKQVWAGLQGIQKAAGRHKDPNSLLESIANNAEQVHAADLLFCAAALEPEVVMTEEEAEGDDNVYPVTYFAAEDRISFLMGTIGGNTEIAKTMRLFRPEPPAHVQDSEALRLVEDKTLASVGSTEEA